MMQSTIDLVDQGVLKNVTNRVKTFIYFGERYPILNLLSIFNLEERVDLFGSQLRFDLTLYNTTDEQNNHVEDFNVTVYFNGKV